MQLYLFHVALKAHFVLPRFTGVNPAGDAGDTSPPIFLLGDVSGNVPQCYYVYFRI